MANVVLSYDDDAKYGFKADAVKYDDRVVARL